MKPMFVSLLTAVAMLLSVSNADQYNDFVADAKSKGYIKNINCIYNNGQIHPQVWGYFDYDQKRAMTEILKNYCMKRHGGPWFVWIDMKSGRQLSEWKNGVFTVR